MVPMLLSKESLVFILCASTKLRTLGAYSQQLASGIDAFVVSTWHNEETVA